MGDIGENPVFSGGDLSTLSADVSPTRAAEEIARFLSTAVDRLTPDGQLPEVGTLEELLRRRHDA